LQNWQAAWVKLDVEQVAVRGRRLLEGACRKALAACRSDACAVSARFQYLRDQRQQATVGDAPLQRR